MRSHKLLVSTLILSLLPLNQAIAQSQTPRIVKPEQNPCINKNTASIDPSALSNSKTQPRTPPKLKTKSLGNLGDLSTVVSPDFSQNVSINSPQSFASIFVLPNLGPVGEVYTPTDLGNWIKVNDKLVSNFFFPSLYFDISSSPILKPEKVDDPEDPSTIKKVRNNDLTMKWMDVTIELFPYCAKTRCICRDKDSKEIPCDSDPIRVLDVLPNQTQSGTKDSIPVQVGGALTDMAGSTTPFFASSSFGVKSEAVAKGMTVLFRNLFPPKTMTYQHAYVDSSTRFGWNFQQNREKPESGGASILGLRRGIVILQVRKDVTSIGIRYAALSKWNKSPNASGKPFDLRGGGLCMPLPQPKPDAPIEYTKLINLDNFPALIPKYDVCKILQIGETLEEKPSDENKTPAQIEQEGKEKEKKARQECDSVYNALIDKNGGYKLEPGPNNLYVKKSSLIKYLGLEKKKEKEKEEDKADK